MWQESGAAYLLFGSRLFLVGTLLVTITCNVTPNGWPRPFSRPASLTIAL